MDHSDSEKGNPMPPHRLLFPINSKGSFTGSIAHTTAFVTPGVEHWLEREKVFLMSAGCCTAKKTLLYYY